MPKILEKTERRLGEKLFIKGERCSSPKCALVRRPYPPGLHGKSRRRRGGSEYAEQLKEKQKIRFIYGIDNNKLKLYFKKAKQKKDPTGRVIRFLEERLDNAVYRLGFAPSRTVARHMVNYGHITVNKKVIDLPSYQVKIGDEIGIKPKSLASSLFGSLDLYIKKYDPPAWLLLDKGSKSGKVLRHPGPDDILGMENISLVSEFYSR